MKASGALIFIKKCHLYQFNLLECNKALNDVVKYLKNKT